MSLIVLLCTGLTGIHLASRGAGPKAILSSH